MRQNETQNRPNLTNKQLQAFAYRTADGPIDLAWIVLAV